MVSGRIWPANEQFLSFLDYHPARQTSRFRVFDAEEIVRNLRSIQVAFKRSHSIEGITFKL
jgi:hypothetical protein